MRDPRRIVVCSASTITRDGHIASVGDEAVTQCLAHGLSTRFPDASVRASLNSSKYPEARLPEGRFPVRPLGELSREIRAADLVVAGGGTLLQEDVRPSLPLPVAGLLRYVLAVAVVSALWRKPFVLYGVGAENLESARARWATRLICRLAQDVILRDGDSARLIAQIAGRSFSVGADAAFLSNGQWHDGANPTPVVCVNVRRDVPGETLGHLAQRLPPLVRGGRLILVPMDRRGEEDSTALLELERLLPVSVTVERVASETTWREVQQVISSADLCIGMRLHFLIFAAMAGRPTLALTSSAKSVSFAREMQLASTPIGGPPEGIDASLAAAAPPPREVVAEHHKRAWEQLNRMRVAQ